MFIPTQKVVLGVSAALGTVAAAAGTYAYKVKYAPKKSTVQKALSTLSKLIRK